MPLKIQYSCLFLCGARLIGKFIHLCLKAVGAIIMCPSGSIVALHRCRSHCSFSPASFTPPISLHLAQSSHCFAPLALLVSPASSASLHPPQAALRLRSHRRGRGSGARQVAYSDRNMRAIDNRPYGVVCLLAFLPSVVIDCQTHKNFVTSVVDNQLT